MINYILRWAFALTLLYSLYGLLLRRESFHRLNRAVLVGILLLSAVLPLCELRMNLPNAVAEPMEHLERSFAPISLGRFDNSATVTIGSLVPNAATEEGAIVPETAVPTKPAPAIGAETDHEAFVWQYILSSVVALYTIGAALLLLHFLVSLASLVRLIRHSQPVHRMGDTRVLVNPALPTACSWMRWIVLRERPDTPEASMICEHEMAHVRLGHSWDMLLAEITARLLWPLPFAWMLRNDLRNVHEYEADQYVVSHGTTRDSYSLMLVHCAARPARSSFAHSFSNHPVKTRLEMMYQKPSKRRATLKAAYLLPLALLSLVCFARPADANQPFGEAERQFLTAEQQVGADEPAFQLLVNSFKENHFSFSVKRIGAADPSRNPETENAVSNGKAESIILDALRQKSVGAPSARSLAGTWKRIGHTYDIDEYRRLSRHTKLDPQDKGFGMRMVLKPGAEVKIVEWLNGTMRSVRLTENAIIDAVSGERSPVEWIADDCMAVREEVGNMPVYIIWQRLTSGESIYEYISTRYKS